MNKQILTQEQYEKRCNKVNIIQLKLKAKEITKDTAIEMMVKTLHYGNDCAKEIVNGWARNFCNPIVTRRYNPNPVMKKVTDTKVVIKNEKDLGIEKEVI